MRDRDQDWLFGDIEAVLAGGPEPRDHPATPSAGVVCGELSSRRVLNTDAYGPTLRLAPPLVIDPGDLTWVLEQLADVVTGLRRRGRPRPRPGE